MRRVCFQVALATLSALAFSSSANAQVLIDFESLPFGTIVTNQFPEVTFSSSTGNLNFVIGPHSFGQFLCTGPAGGAITCIEDTYLDFTSPASGLTFQAIEPNCACLDAQFRIFQNGVFTATVDLIGLGGNGTKPVDLSAYPNITRLEIVNILVDPILENGIGWDQFSFTQPGTTYCTARTTSCGSSPSISANGGAFGVISEANGAPAYDVTLSGVPDDPAGGPALLIHTPNGPNPSPPAQSFGLLCIATPFFHGPALGGPAAGGGGTCDGVYSWDFAAYVTGLSTPGAKAAVGIVSGNTIDIQAWARDPANAANAPFGTANFSNAFGTTVGP